MLAHKIDAGYFLGGRFGGLLLNSRRRFLFGCSRFGSGRRRRFFAFNGENGRRRKIRETFLRDFKQVTGGIETVLAGRTAHRAALCSIPVGKTPDGAAIRATSDKCRGHIKKTNEQ